MVVKSKINSLFNHISDVLRVLRYNWNNSDLVMTSLFLEELLHFQDRIWDVRDQYSTQSLDVQ